MGQIFSTLPVCTGASMRCGAAVSGLKLLLSFPTLVHHCQFLGLHLLLGCALWLFSTDSPYILPVCLPSVLGWSAVLSLFLLETKKHFSWKHCSSKLQHRCAAVGMCCACHSGTLNLTNEISPFKNYSFKNMLVCHRLVIWMRIHPAFKWIYMPMLSRLVFYWGLCVILQC